MKSLFNPQLLTEYMSTFYGYSDYSAPFWFVGMEEGGGSTPEENANRITSWERRGRPEVTNLYECHQDIAVPRWFAAHPPIQPGASSSAFSSPPRVNNQSRPM